jgi:prevent-host-death family protein
MKAGSVLTAVSVADAKARLEELMAIAAEEPVEIVSAGGRSSCLVSKEDFDSMVASFEELTDQVWLLRAELARAGGFVGEEEMKEIMMKLESAAHAEADADQ